jgi:hypothetical protein
MKIYVSIDGVLRNTIQKFKYHYTEYFFEREPEEENNFDYGIELPLTNGGLLNHFKFQSKEEFDFFTYVEFAIEIFGHAGLSYSSAFTELNKIIHENPNDEFYLVGMDEFGKARPATLFFLSKNGFTGFNVKFSESSKLENLWSECDCWITDSEKILTSCLENKIAFKFNTDFNQHFTHNNEINKLSEINQKWSHYLEKHTTLMLTESQKNVEQTAQ